MRQIRAACGKDREGAAIYKQVGTLIEKNGKEMIKIDMLPVDFNGWLFISKPKAGESKPRPKNSEYEAAMDVLAEDLEDY